MKLSLFAFAGLLASTVTGLAIPSPNAEAEPVALAEAEPEALVEREALSAVAAASNDASIIVSAAKSWAGDAKIVSKFLDNIAGKKFKDQAAYLLAAEAAYAAEQAEFALKNIIAQYLLNNPSCQAANATLSNGDTWGNVLDLLEQLTELDWVADQAQIQQILNEINFGEGAAQGRCSAILPAFDTYFTQAGKLLPSLGSRNVIRGLRAYVPRSCSSNSARDVLEG